MSVVLNRILIAASLGVGACHAQPALVTFYSAGCSHCVKAFVFDTLAGSAVVPYGGPVYDRQTKLIKNILPNRFVTIRMQPGEHAFIADHMGVLAVRRTAAQDQDLRLTLQPGKHYFVSLSTRDSGATYVLRRFSPILASKDCTEAFQEAAQTQPLQPAKIGGQRMTDVEPSLYFPTCEANGGSGQ